MRLSHVEVRDVRSIFPDSHDQPLALELGSGMNTLVGRNNCGKSNVLRAITLALDPTCALDPSVDLPGSRPFASPEITTTFELAASEHEEELLDLHRQWRTMIGAPVDQDDRRLRLRVTFTRRPDGGFARNVTLLPQASSASSADLHDRIIDQLFRSVRVVGVTSGQGLEAFLEGNFRAVLHNVLTEHLRDEVEAATVSREEYITGLEERLLDPLRVLLGKRLQQLFTEIGGLALHPDVPDLEETLARVAVSVTDAVETPLSAKGTGVRGGVLVALLSYLADNAKRGLVFLIEEPEAFLHPSAQEDLRDTLEGIAGRPDVTTIVTSHSPFIASRRREGQIVALTKDAEGRTRIQASGAGDSDHAHLIGGLVRPSTFNDVLQAATTLPEGKRAVLLVEGQGDKFCLELAARRAGRADLIDDIDIRATGGTTKLVLEAIVARAALQSSGVPVAVLVDGDEEGLSVIATLKGEKFKFQKENICRYSEILKIDSQDQFPYEAEDMWPAELMQRFVDHHGDTMWDGMQKRPDGEVHYDLGQASKDLLPDHFLAEVDASHCTRWIELLELIRRRMKLDAPSDPRAKKAPEPPIPPPRQEDVLVLTGHEPPGQFEQWSLVTIPTSIELPDHLTHVAFYDEGAIQPTIPAVRRVFRNLMFSPEVADDLRDVGGDAERAGELMKELLDSGAVPANDLRHVLILSSEDANDAVTLRSAVTNTRTIRGDRAVAWIVGPKVVPLAALEAGPASTTELDQLLAGEKPAFGQSP